MAAEFAHGVRTGGASGEDPARAAGFLVTFILGRSAAFENELDGFAAAPNGSLLLLPEETKWLAIEAERAPLLLELASRAMAAYSETAEEVWQQRYTLLFMKGRLRPALQIFSAAMARPPNREVLDTADATIGLVGGRDWVYWLGDTDEGLAQGAVGGSVGEG